MEMFARVSKGKNLRFVQVTRPRSLFDFAEGRYKGLDTLRRILTQARCHGVQTIAIEELDPSQEIIEENEDLLMLAKTAFTSHTYRLSLFSKQIHHQNHLDKLTDRDFIGYVIIKNDLGINKNNHGLHIYESAIRKSRHPHNFIHREQKWSCLVGKKTFNVSGYLFFQQNGLTNVCAHAALRTVLASFESGNLVSYRKINEILDIDHKLKFAQEGLRSDEIEQVLKKLGVGCFVGDFKAGNKSPIPFQRVLYSGIESGYPAIVFFKTNRRTHHAIPVFGHTFNEDTWVPGADHCYFSTETDHQCIYSDAWLSMFIGHDDNIGSNLCIPKHYLQTKRQYIEEQASSPAGGAIEIDSVAYIISTYPKEVEMYFAKAEAAAIETLVQILDQIKSKSLPWVRRLIDFQQKNQIVVRPVLVTSAEYLAHLRKVRDWDTNPALGDSLNEVAKWLCDKRLFWMIEFSVPELFSATKRKMAEVLLRADATIGSPADLTNQVCARLPGSFVLPIEHGPWAGTETFRFLPSGLLSHIEAYRCEEGLK